MKRTTTATRLAIDGGTPAITEPLPAGGFGVELIDDREIAAAAAVRRGRKLFRFHENSQCEALEREARIKLLLGHCINNRWHEAVALAKDFPNIYLELCSVPGKRGVVELFVEKVGSRRILYGTDLPWFYEHQGIGALLSADITDDDRHNILHRNAERLLGIAPGA